MKIIELKLTDGETGEGITAISLVSRPAIEQNWIAFNSQEEIITTAVNQVREKQYAFKTIDEEQRVLAGPAMIPEKLIYRLDDQGEESFVFFKEDTIRELSERFLLQGKQSSLTLEHEATLNDLTVIESWIVEDPKRDKSAIYGFDLPVGTWFVKVKVLNNDIWGLVKEKSVAGFSVEGVFTRQIIKNSKQMSKLDEHLDKIRKLFGESPTVAPDESPEVFGTVEAISVDGATVVINYPGEVLEVGAAITHTVEDQEQPVPTGEYTLPDGTILVVAVEGVVEDLRPAEVAPMEQEEHTEDGLKAEQIDALIEGIGEILATFKAEMETRFSGLIQASEKKLRDDFNKPAVTPAQTNPEDDTKKSVIRGLNKFVSESKK